MSKLRVAHGALDVAGGLRKGRGQSGAVRTSKGQSIRQKVGKQRGAVVQQPSGESSSHG